MVGVLIMSKLYSTQTINSIYTIEIFKHEDGTFTYIAMSGDESILQSSIYSPTFTDFDSINTHALEAVATYNDDTVSAMFNRD